LAEVSVRLLKLLRLLFPDERSPWTFADEWATNLMKMFAEGISSNIPKVRSAVDDATGRIREWFVELPEVAIQAVGEVTDWIISLPEVAVNATGRVMSWIVDLSTLAVNAVGYITEWVTNVPELETPIEAIARITKWVVDSIPDITLLGHIDLENIPIPITPISLNPPTSTNNTNSPIPARRITDSKHSKG